MLTADKTYIIHGEGLGLPVALDRDALLLCVRKHIVATLEFVEKFLVPPRRNHIDARGQRLERELEANLVVAFARGPMGECTTAVVDRSLHGTLGNARASEGSTHEVSTLIHSIRLHGRDNVVLPTEFTGWGSHEVKVQLRSSTVNNKIQEALHNSHERLPEVTDDAVDGANLLGLLLCVLKVLVLAQISHIANYFVALLDQVVQDHGSVKATTVLA